MNILHNSYYLTSSPETDHNIFLSRQKREALYAIADLFIREFINSGKAKEKYQAGVDYLMKQLEGISDEDKTTFVEYLWQQLSKDATEVPLPVSADKAKVFVWDPNAVSVVDIHPLDRRKTVKIYKRLAGKSSNVFFALSNLGIEAKFFSTRVDKQTRKAVLIDAFRKIVLIGESEKLSRQEVKQTIQNISYAINIMPRGGIFLFGGALPENLAPEELKYFIEEAKRNKVFIIVDFSLKISSRQALSILKAGPYLIKPNLREFEMLCRYTHLIRDGYSFNSNSETKRAEIGYYAKIISDKFNIPAVIVTLGGNGALLYSANRLYYGSSEVPEREIVGLIGSGDSFCAGVVKALLKQDLLNPKDIDWKAVFSMGIKVSSAKIRLPGLTMPVNDLVEEQKEPNIVLYDLNPDLKSILSPVIEPLTKKQQERRPQVPKLNNKGSKVSPRGLGEEGKSSSALQKVCARPYLGGLREKIKAGDLYYCWPRELKERLSLIAEMCRDILALFNPHQADLDFSGVVAAAPAVKRIEKQKCLMSRSVPNTDVPEKIRISSPIKVRAAISGLKEMII
ncbi:MAG TPA: hypothetical protein ENI51_01805, partial [Candidatus Atribacteria bacterium]|nr:hypothetical protein [Candidatus Atribacteria bacterium]